MVFYTLYWYIKSQRFILLNFIRKSYKCTGTIVLKFTEFNKYFYDEVDLIVNVLILSKVCK